LVGIKQQWRRRQKILGSTSSSGALRQNRGGRDVDVAPPVSPRPEEGEEEEEEEGEDEEV
jgi:hypothetical protein